MKISVIASLIDMFASKKETTIIECYRAHIERSLGQFHNPQRENHQNSWSTIEQNFIKMYQ